MARRAEGDHAELPKGCGLSRAGYQHEPEDCSRSKTYASRTAAVWNTTVRRRVLTVRPAKEIWWVDYESDEGEAERDPRNLWISDTDMCDCVDSLEHNYWRGCLGRTLTGQQLRGGCSCSNSYEMHTDMCNSRYDPQGQRGLVGCQRSGF